MPARSSPSGGGRTQPSTKKTSASPVPSDRRAGTKCGRIARTASPGSADGTAPPTRPRRARSGSARPSSPSPTAFSHRSTSARLAAARNRSSSSASRRATRSRAPAARSRSTAPTGSPAAASSVAATSHQSAAGPTGRPASVAKVRSTATFDPSGRRNPGMASTSARAAVVLVRRHAPSSASRGHSARRSSAPIRARASGLRVRWSRARVTARSAPASWLVAARRRLSERSMLCAMDRSWPSSASKRVRESRQTVTSVSATTVAVRGESVRRAISPKPSPGPRATSGLPSPTGARATTTTRPELMT